jgi:effector-binding domain-containing protein
MYEIRALSLVAQHTIVIRDKVRVPDLPQWFARVFTETTAAISRASATIVGPPFARYRPLGAREFEVEAGFPVAEAMAADGEVIPSMLPAGPAIATWHIGPYDTMTPAYDAILAWMEREGAEPAGPPWETYHSQSDEDPATWRTEIVQPYRIFTE